MTTSKPWPSLPLEEWSDTLATLHLWLQIVGKVRLVQNPWLNHSWHATLYVTSTGLTTSPIPYHDRSFQFDFDFCEHRLKLLSSDGRGATMRLEPVTVAAFYSRLMEEMKRLDLHVEINKRPCEMVDVIPFDLDEVHGTYDPDFAGRFWRILVQIEPIFNKFRARFIGKCSPVHLFWGAADLAVTRFSGRRAPEHPGGIPNLPDWVTREAYSHEVSSSGFWPGGGPIPYPAFYSYAYPEPPGYSEAVVGPVGAFYSSELREFILPYELVRAADFPDKMLLNFLESSYLAAAELARWDRKTLEGDRDPRILP